jgi:hypothetical protein
VTAAVVRSARNSRRESGGATFLGANFTSLYVDPFDAAKLGRSCLTESGGAWQQAGVSSRRARAARRPAALAAGWSWTRPWSSESACESASGPIDWNSGSTRVRAGGSLRCPLLLQRVVDATEERHRPPLRQNDGLLGQRFLVGELVAAAGQKLL